MLRLKPLTGGTTSAAHLLVLTLLFTSLFPAASPLSPPEEIDYGPRGWVPEENVTIFSRVTDVGGIAEEGEFRLFRGGSWSTWMGANISRSSGALNLSAVVSLEEGEEVYYQFRTLSGGEVLSTFPHHLTGRDSCPPIVTSVNVPPGPFFGLPEVTLEVTFGPSGPSWEIPFNVTGSDWSAEGRAHLFSRGDGRYVVVALSAKEELGVGEAQVRMEVSDGAGNVKTVRFTIRLIRGAEVRGMWPMGGVLTEALQQRGFVIESLGGFEGAERVYLFSGPLNRTYTSEVEGVEHIPGRGIALKAPDLEKVIRALPPGSYFWQAFVRMDGYGILTRRANFTLLGSLRDVSLGLPPWAASSEMVELSPPDPLGERILEGLTGVNVTLLSPSGTVVEVRFLPLLAGGVVKLPQNPYPYPLYLEFPTGEWVRLEPEEKNWSVEIVPGAPPDVRISSATLGIDPTTLKLILPGGRVRELWQEVRVTTRGEIVSGREAPTGVEAPLWGLEIEEGSEFVISFQDALPSSPWHNITFSKEGLPPRPKVVASFLQGSLTLSVVCLGQGRIPIESVDIFRVVEGRVVPLTTALEVNVTGEEVIVTPEERVEILVELGAGGDIYYWRGEISPIPFAEPEIRWETSGGDVHLWIENLPPKTEKVRWRVGKVVAEGRAVTLSLENVGGEEVRATVVTEEGTLNLTATSSLPKGPERGIGSPLLPIILVVALGLILLGIVIYTRVRPAIPVKMELVQEEVIPGSSMTGRAAGVKRVSLHGPGRGRPRLPSASAKSFSPTSKVKGAEDIYNCAICLKPILPPQEPVKCACGERFHRGCALRKGICPRCGRDIMVEEVGDL